MVDLLIMVITKRNAINRWQYPFGSYYGGAKKFFMVTKHTVISL